MAWRKVFAMQPLFRFAQLILLLGSSSMTLAQSPETGVKIIVSTEKSDSSRTSQNAPATRHNIIKINPLSLSVGQLSVFYEHALTRQVSAVVGYGIGGNNFSFGSALAQGGCTYQRGTLEIRRYWGKNGIKGWYTGPYLRVSQLRVSHFEPNPAGQHVTGSWQVQHSLVWMPGILAGHQWLIRRFAFEVFAGLQGQIVAGTLDRSNQVVEGMTSPVSYRVGLTVGLPF